MREGQVDDRVDVGMDGECGACITAVAYRDWRLAWEPGYMIHHLGIVERDGCSFVDMTTDFVFLPKYGNGSSLVSRQVWNTGDDRWTNTDGEKEERSFLRIWKETKQPRPSSLKTLSQPHLSNASPVHPAQTPKPTRLFLRIPILEQIPTRDPIISIPSHHAGTPHPHPPQTHPHKV